MPNWFVAVSMLAFVFGLAGHLIARVIVPTVRIWWRRRRLRAALDREQLSRDPVRLQELAQQAAHAEAKDQSERAALFCERYAADLIADGVNPKDAYAEALAIYTNEVA